VFPCPPHCPARTVLTAAIRPIDAWLWDMKRSAVRTKAPCARCDVQV
jgi:hypothetical protein